MSRDLDVFLTSITPYAPGVAAPTAYKWIREAAIEFCTRTRMWRYEDSFTITGDEAEGVSTPFGSVLLDIETVTFNDGAPLEPKTSAWLDAHCQGWRSNANPGRPQYLTQIDMNTIRVVPGEAGTVNISVWLKPSEDCEDLPDFMADQYREVIAHGALGRILMLPSQPYTNGNLATAFLASFDNKLVGLSQKGITGQQRARVRTKASYF